MSLGKEVKPDSRQGFLTNILRCIHNASFQKRGSLPLHFIHSISLSAQGIPSVHNFYGLHALYLATLHHTVWFHSSPLPLSMHQGNEWFSVKRLCLLRNLCVYAESKFPQYNPSDDELPWVFAGLTLVCWTNLERRASAATCCAHVVLIDVSKKYDCCPTQQQTRPMEILWISVAQADLTHQQNRNHLDPQGVLLGIHQGQVWGGRWPVTFGSQ